MRIGDVLMELLGGRTQAVLEAWPLVEAARRRFPHLADWEIAAIAVEELQKTEAKPLTKAG